MDFDKGIIQTLLHQGLLDLPQLDLDSPSLAFSCSSHDQKRKMMMYLVAQPFRDPVPKYREVRRNGAWEEHVTKCLYKKGEFQSRYHMSFAAFRTLVNYLDIQIDHKQSLRSSRGIEPIDANIVVACGLRWLD